MRSSDVAPSNNPGTQCSFWNVPAEEPMAVSRRSTISIVVFVLLGVFVTLGYWYESRQVQPGQAANSPAVNVTSGSDRGPGTLREALFIAAAADGEVTISMTVPKITLATALPPVANAHGIRLVGAQQGTEIDGTSLASGPILDVAGANVSIEGLRIRNCKSSA